MAANLKMDLNLKKKNARAVKVLKPENWFVALCNVPTDCRAKMWSTDQWFIFIEFILEYPYFFVYLFTYLLEFYISTKFF